MPASSSQLRCCDNEDVAFELFGEVDNLLGFAGTDQITGMLFAMINQLPVDHRDAERIDKFFELLEQTLGIGFFAGIGVRADEKGALDQFVFGFDLEHCGVPI
jgi:hypothetical protein